jgi:uncharacterized membrane protein YczE
MAVVDSVFTVAFYVSLAALLAAFGAFVMASWTGSRIIVSTTHANSPAEPFPAPERVRLTARWLQVCFKAVVWSVPVGAVIVAIVGNIAVGVLLPVFLVGLSVATWLPTTIRCPKCTKHLVMNAGGQPPFGEPLKGLSAWGSVIKRIDTERQFRCMYCGQRFTT